MVARASVGLIAAALLTALIFSTLLCTTIAVSQFSAPSAPSGPSTPGGGGGGSSGSGSPLLSGQGLDCSTLGAGENCFASGNLTSAGFGYGGCAANPPIPDAGVPSVGTCYFVNDSLSETVYTSYAGNGQIIKSPISTGVTNPIPVMSDVIGFNNRNTPYLITCPVAPQPTNSIEYISDPGTYIAGNRCLASIEPLLTTVSLTSQVQITSPFGFFFNPGPTTTNLGGPAPTSGLTQSYTIKGFARGSITNLGFSGEASTSGTAYNLSSSYDTKSYIFQQVNGTPQQGIWTWTAEYANLSHVNLGYLHLNYSSSDDELLPDGLAGTYEGMDLGITAEPPYVAFIFVTCSIPYVLTINSLVTNLANANVPIPIYNTTAGGTTGVGGSKNYVKIGKYLYSPVTTVTSSSACFTQLLAGGPSCGKTWQGIGNNASAYYSSQTYNNLAVYVSTTSPASPTNPYYIVPINSGSTHMLLETTAASGIDYGNVMIFPYFNYNAVLPSTYSQFIPPSFLNMYYGIYSPNNYAGVTNSYSIETTGVEPYNLYSGGGLLVNYTGTTSSGSKGTKDIADFPFSIASASANTYYDTFPKVSGKSVVFANISNPAFITETPNGFVYILNYSVGSSFLHLSTTTSAYIYKLKYIPSGDYNYSVSQPSQFAQKSTLAAWTTQAKNYFAAALLAQSPSLYVLSAAEFTTTSTPNWCLFGKCLGSTKGSISSSALTSAPFLPLAAVSDYDGDLFLVSAPLPGSASSGSFSMAEITASGTVLVNTVTIASGGGMVPSQEMAVAPGGEYVYLANASYPAINIYSTKGGNFIYVGNIPLTYSNASYNMNIATYLSHGGPYNTNQIATAYTGTYTMDDVPVFHHPLAITDVQGTLFVLDNWTFGPTSASSSITVSPLSPGTTTTVLKSPLGSIWMLRAFQDNGTVEIPIAYSSNKTVVAASSVAAPASPFSGASGYTYWPPYGWPLTANVSLDSSLLSGGTATGPYVSLCEYSGSNACTSYGNTIGYSSIGPEITTLGQVAAKSSINPEQLGISSDFEGDIYLMVHDSVGQTHYAQLLIIKPNINNYTKIDVDSGTPFQCYSNTTGTPNCITANFISNFYPPLIGMPDAFEYLSSQGSPLQYFSVPTGLSSVLPVGAGTSPNTASIFNSGNTGGTNYSCLTTNSPSTCGNVIAYSTANQLRTYITGLIGGYVITPYNITLAGKVNYTYQPANSTVVPGTEINPQSATPLDNNLCDFAYIGPKKTGPKTNYTNVVTSIGSSSITRTIEGGGIYAQYNSTLSNYQPNLSDQALVMPPDLGFNVTTNRLLGEIYINQTISPATANSSISELEEYVASSIGPFGAALCSLAGSSVCPTPQVLNASRNYNYTEDVYIQTIDNPLASGFASIGGGFGGSGTGLSSIGALASTCGGFCAPAYDAENAIPTGVTPNNTVIGANCGSSCPSTLPSTISTLTGTNPLTGLPASLSGLAGLGGYYYGSNYLPNNNFTYSESNQTSYFDLFSLFRRAAYTYGLGLNLSNTPQIYGYNRLVYTYVDRFNNTVYMPIDIDFANTTLLTLSAPSTVNTLNVNQTQIEINGTLQFIEPNGVIVPARSGSSIYLYYNTNINYYNTSVLSELAGSGLASGAVGDILGSGSYYKWAEDCAFAPQGNGCVLANPLSTLGLSSVLGSLSGIPSTSPSTLTSDATMALESLTNQTTYAPNYASGGQCATQPNSLLALSQYNCNINGASSDAGSLLSGLSGQLPATATGANGNQQYCVPEFTNGTGYLTSQLGLIAVVQTNSIGGFNDTITACGVGTGRIIAQYYGAPGPEPISVAQSQLPYSVTPLSANVANDIISPEYDYGFAPNVTSAPFKIGSYQLSLGNLYAWIPIIIILILLMASKSALGKQGSIFELFGFSTLANAAAGVGAGPAGSRGIRRGYTTTEQRIRNPAFDRFDDLIKARKGRPSKSVTTTSGRPRPSAPGAGIRFPSSIFEVNKDNIGDLTGKGGSMNGSDFYKFLGLSTMPATLEEAKAAWVKQRKLFQPNADKDDPDATAKATAVNRAWELAQVNLKSAASTGGKVSMSASGRKAENASGPRTSQNTSGKKGSQDTTTDRKQEGTQPEDENA